MGSSRCLRCCRLLAAVPSCRPLARHISAASVAQVARNPFPAVPDQNLRRELYRTVIAMPTTYRNRDNSLRPGRRTPTKSSTEAAEETQQPVTPGRFKLIVRRLAVELPQAS